MDSRQGFIRESWKTKWVSRLGPLAGPRMGQAPTPDPGGGGVAALSFLPSGGILNFSFLPTIAFFQFCWAFIQQALSSVL